MDFHGVACPGSRLVFARRFYTTTDFGTETRVFTIRPMCILLSIYGSKRQRIARCRWLGCRFTEHFLGNT
jgi:hypothetical protein